MATLSDYLKNQINPDPTITNAANAAIGKVNTGVQGVQNFATNIGSGLAEGFARSAPNPLALAPGESKVDPTANTFVSAPTIPAVAPVMAVNPLNTPLPVNIPAPSTGGVRRYSSNPVASTSGQQLPPDQPVASEVPIASALAAYQARTGVDVTNLPSNGLVTNLGSTAKGPEQVFGELANQTANETALSNQNKAMNAFYASPEGQQVTATAGPGGPVEVVRGDKTNFEDFTPGVDTALQNYLFGLKQTQQQQADYTSAVNKPVNAKLTLGEATAMNALNPEVQGQTQLGVAGIGAGAEIGKARIMAEAGKNPLYNAAAEDLATTTDPAAKARKLQQYLGTKAPVDKADPMDKVYAEQLIMPNEQQAYAGLRALNETPAAAFAAVKQKFGTKK